MGSLLGGGALLLGTLPAQQKFDQPKRITEDSFILNAKSLGQPRLNGRGAVRCFPFLQRLVIAAFGFDDFAGIRVFIDLYLARFGTTGFKLN